MKVTNLQIDGLKLIEPQVFSDSRGWFYESYSYEKLRELGIDAVFVQDNRSYSSQAGTIRGVHFQKGEAAQAKLVSCTRGSIIDVAVDLRRGSPTYLKWVAVELSAQNKRMLFIPRGFGHAFESISDDAELFYKVDRYYCRESDRSIRYDDPQIGISWKTKVPILSDKDKNAPLLELSDADFIYEG